MEQEIKNRLNEAEKLTDLSAENKDILVQIINMELKGSLTGSYADVPSQVYHHPLCSGYSSTTLKRITEQSYNHWFVSRDEESKSLFFGSAFHAFCNEPEIFSQEYVISTADKRNSADYKALAKKHEKSGVKILTAPEFKMIEVMSKKLFEHPDSAPLIKQAKSEIAFFSQDQETGLWKKCKLDSLKGRSISDLKTTTNAAPLSFASDARKYLYRVSASFYLEVVSEVTGVQHKDFYLIACENEAPHEVAVYRVDDGSIEKAQTEIRTALAKIKKVLTDGPNAWTGYATGIKDIAI